MTWVRVDDAAPMHPKFLEAGPEASWLWVAGVAHCNRSHTNGVIRKVFLTALYPSGHWTITKLRALAEQLVKVRLWHDEGDHYRVHQYEIQQEAALKENVESRRAADKERKRVSREARRSRTCPGQVTDKPTNVTNVNAESPHLSDHPVPTRPDPSRPVTEILGGPPASPPPTPVVDPEVRIGELEAAYPAELITAARAGCARYRKTGRMAPGVWLATLETLSAYAPSIVVPGLRTFVDRYSTGEHDERYLLGIVRGESERARKSSGWRPPTDHETYAASATKPAEMASLFADVTEDDLARIERLGNRRAHG